MKGLTLTQPWATLIALGIKRIENRKWKPPANMIGERFAIHASREIDPAVTAILPDDARRALLAMMRAGGDLPTSQIVATARLVGFFDDVAFAGDQARWFTGPYAFVLDDIRPIDLPTKIKGALSFWRLAPEIDAELAEIEAQRFEPPPCAAEANGMSRCEKSGLPRDAWCLDCDLRETDREERSRQ